MGIRSRTIFDMNYLVHLVDEKDNIIETIAAADHFSVANAAFAEAPKHITHGRIQMRNKARIVKTRLPDGRIVD